MGRFRSSCLLLHSFTHIISTSSFSLHSRFHSTATVTNLQQTNALSFPSLFQSEKRLAFGGILLRHPILSSSNDDTNNEIEKIAVEIPSPATAKATNTVTIEEQIETLQQNGIITLASVVSIDVADAFLNFIQDQKILAWFSGFEAQANTSIAVLNRTFYGKEQSELSCDLQLSLLRSGFVADLDKNTSKLERHILADTLQGLLLDETSLSQLSELCHKLVSEEGSLNELGAFMTEPGYLNDLDPTSSSTNVDSTLRADTGTVPIVDAPLYKIAVALDDINQHMGPTTFFLKSHTHDETERQRIRSTYNKDDIDDDTIPTYTAMLQKGDAILYDARIMKCNQPNDAMMGSTNAMLQLSFQNPNYKGENNDLKSMTGTLRPGYMDAIHLGDLSATVLVYRNGDGDAFAKYGDGISNPFLNTKSEQTEIEFTSESKSE